MLVTDIAEKAWISDQIRIAIISAEEKYQHSYCMQIDIGSKIVNIIGMDKTWVSETPLGERLLFYQ